VQWPAAETEAIERIKVTAAAASRHDVSRRFIEIRLRRCQELLDVVGMVNMAKTAVSTACRCCLVV